MAIYPIYYLKYHRLETFFLFFSFTFDPCDTHLKNDWERMRITISLFHFSQNLQLQRLSNGKKNATFKKEKNDKTIRDYNL